MYQRTVKPLRRTPGRRGGRAGEGGVSGYFGGAGDGTGVGRGSLEGGTSPLIRM